MLNGMKSTLEEAEEQINDLENRVMESNQEQKRKKIVMQNENGHNSVTPSNVLTLVFWESQKETAKGEKFYLKK